MSSSNHLINWCIQRYKVDGGEGIPDAEASGVTATKVQIRNSDGDLLQEYEKDFVKFKLQNNTINTQESESSLKERIQILIITCIIGSAVSVILYKDEMPWLSALFVNKRTSTDALGNQSHNEPKPESSQFKSIKVGDYCPGVYQKEYLDKLLNEGWKVVSAMPFNDYHARYYSSNDGRYCNGVLYNLER